MHKAKGKFTIFYEARKEILKGTLEISTPPLTKQEAVEFITVIGAKRLIAIFENDQLINAEKASEMVIEAESLGAKMVSSAKTQNRHPSYKKLP